MPHLSVECSRGLTGMVDMDAFCKALHGAMLEIEAFPVAGIRIRVHVADHAIVADGLPENNFAALTLAVGAGRGKDVLKAAGTKIFAAAQAFLAGPLSEPHFALSLEIRVIDPDLSWKDTPIHKRLSAGKVEMKHAEPE